MFKEIEELTIFLKLLIDVIGGTETALEFQLCLIAQGYHEEFFKPYYLIRDATTNIKYKLINEICGVSK